LAAPKVGEVFEPLIHPSRYKAAYGGRGSGKSHFFATWMVLECYRKPGTFAICIREVQKTLAESSKRLIEDKINELGFGEFFEIQHDRIVTPGGGLILFQGMQNHTAESIKSLEGYRIAWIEEAQTLSARSLELLRPTIRDGPRVTGSQIWASWNPRRKQDAVDKFFREEPPENAIVVKANWRDNPWWKNTGLEDERKLDLARYPERYPHIWEGEYARAFEGAYFASLLLQAKDEGRISRVSRDPLLTPRAFWDIGGAGAQSDATAIWITQWVGREIRVIDYHEASGQTLAYHISWLRERKYGSATCYLPHDGMATNNVTGLRYEDHIAEAGFEVVSIRNQGRGAAAQRIEAVRRILPFCWFNEKTTEVGRDALGFYHEKKDEHRATGMGPEHDWSSHSADAFGLMAICYEAPFEDTIDSLFGRARDQIADTRSDITGY
jgi:phage terminase large subunit